MTLELPTPPDWMADAVCASVDPELFYPHEGGSVRFAQAVCAVCPVQAECLDYALEMDDVYGVWGGMGVGQRRRVAKKKAA